MAVAVSQHIGMHTEQGACILIGAVSVCRTVEGITGSNNSLHRTVQRTKRVKAREKARHTKAPQALHHTMHAWGGTREVSAQPRWQWNVESRPLGTNNDTGIHEVRKRRASDRGIGIAVGWRVVGCD